MFTNFLRTKLENFIKNLTVNDIEYHCHVDNLGVEDKIQRLPHYIDDLFGDDYIPPKTNNTVQTKPIKQSVKQFLTDLFR